MIEKGQKPHQTTNPTQTKKQPNKLLNFKGLKQLELLLFWVGLAN